MRKIIDWTCGSFFRTIGRILVYVAIALLITLLASNGYIKLPNLFLLNAKAATLTSKSTFTDDTNHYIGSGEITSFGSNNTYSYSTLTPNVQGRYVWNNSSTGTAVSGKAYALSMGFQYNLTAQKYYDITINFRDRDVRYTVNISNITLLAGTSISGMTDTPISLIGLTNTATSSSNTNKLVVRVYTLEAISYFAIQFSGGNTNLTSVNNFGISSVSILEVDVSNTNVIIDNATNNTQNIINNNNDNTQQIIDNQNSLLGTQCLNEFNFPFHQDNPFSLTATRDDYSMLTNYSIHLLANVEYNFSYKSNYPFGATTDNSSVEFFLFKDGVASGNIHPREKSGTFTPTITGDYFLRLDCNKNGDTCLFWDFLISSKTSNYCEYGSYISKLDDTTNAIDNLNDNINNDNVSSATSSASNFFSNFTTNTHGLTSIITSPLSAIQSLTNSTCTPLVLPIPFVNENLTLPCMRDIYVSNFGGFMTLYDVITLGIISYWVLVRIFTLVKDFKNPEHDEIEVVDL